MAKRLYIQLYNANSGESITLPINPESIDLTKEKSINTYNILDFGEVPIRGNRQLQRINLSGLLPAENTVFALLASLIKELRFKPYSLAETNTLLEKWLDNNDVIRVIISGRLNKEFLIERHTPTIREYTDDEYDRAKPDKRFVGTVELKLPPNSPKDLSLRCQLRLNTEGMLEVTASEPSGKRVMSTFKLQSL